MDISITKPYQNLNNRDIEFDSIVRISLDGKELEDLFELLDNELHYNETREDLLKENNDLIKENSDLEDEVCNLQKEIDDNS